MSEQELDVQLDEFKASGEDSEVAEPTAVKAKKRMADKGDAGEKGGAVSDGATGKGGDLIDSGKAQKKAPARKADKSMGEHIEDIFSGEDLSEEFKEKAAVIFETVVNQRVDEQVKTLEEEFSTKLDEQVESITEDLTKKIDTYLDYVVEEWMKENKLAVERGIRSEITESFIDGLKGLFAEHRISVPDEEVDLVAEMADKIEELEKKLNEETDSVLELRKQVEEAKKGEVFEEVAEGLADTQVEKLRSLTEGLEYVDLEDYRRKVEIVKENYFSKTEITEEKDDLDPVDSEESTQYVDPNVARYAQSITKTFKNIR
jgi:hypothetical protein